MSVGVVPKWLFACLEPEMDSSLTVKRIRVDCRRTNGRPPVVTSLADLANLKPLTETAKSVT